MLVVGLGVGCTPSFDRPRPGPLADSAAADRVPAADRVAQADRLGPDARPACSASNCPDGCCTPEGVCLDGDTAAACGSAGQACGACPAGSCVAGKCNACPSTTALCGVGAAAACAVGSGCVACAGNCPLWYSCQSGLCVCAPPAGVRNGLCLPGCEQLIAYLGKTGKSACCNESGCADGVSEVGNGPYATHDCRRCCLDKNRTAPKLCK